MQLTPDFLLIGLISYIVFLFSTTCHEASHSLAAKLGGDLTAFHAGQVSLNPIPHVRREPFGMVVVPLLALFTGGMMIGWASAPYDPQWQHKYPRRAAWMSLAGPAANFALMLVAALVIRVGLASGGFTPPMRLSSMNLVQGAGLGELAARLVSILFSLNLLLGFFNLLPIPPLDGFSAITLLMPAPVAARWERIGLSIRPYAFLALLVGWQLFEKIYYPVFRLGLGLLYPASMYQ